MFQQLLDLFGPYRNGAIFDPSDEKDIEIIIDLLALKPADKAVDIGSGDGRIVSAMARKGAMAYGIEYDPDLVKKSTDSIYAEKLETKASIIYSSFWDINLHQFNKITIYQYYTVMDRLEKKILHEVQPGSYIVSHLWKFPTWKPAKKIKEIYLYIKE